jgi:bifunctional non-homologous end joining protein LigD
MAATIGLTDLSSLHPMPLVRIPEPFDHEQFVFELKHDGFRALAVTRGHHCELISRRGHVYRFPQLAEELAHAVRADNAILDGEIVCLDAQGRSQFYSLLFRREWPYFMAFDALHIDGEDLRNRPLLERKRRLRALVPRVETRFLYLDHVERRGIDLFQAVCRADLEGVVAKWNHGPYHTDGVTTSWLKIKNPTYSQAIGRSDAFEGRISRQASRRPAPPVLRLSANVQLDTHARQTNRGTRRERE